MRAELAKYAVLLFVLAGGCGSDLYTKQLATEGLADGDVVPLVSGYLDLRYTENEGAAFSALGDLPDGVRVPVLIGLQGLISLVMCLVIIRLRRRSLLTLLPFALILAGGLGNLIDRIRFGSVVDFVHFHVQGAFSWPIFNLADVWIAVGIALLALALIAQRDRALDPTAP